MQTLKTIYHLFPIELWMAIFVMGVMVMFVVITVGLLLFLGDNQNEDK